METARYETPIPPPDPPIHIDRARARRLVVGCLRGFTYLCTAMVLLFGGVLAVAVVRARPEIFFSPAERETRIRSHAPGPVRRNDTLLHFVTLRVDGVFNGCGTLIEFATGGSAPRWIVTADHVIRKGGGRTVTFATLGAESITGQVSRCVPVSYGRDIVVCSVAAEPMNQLPPIGYEHDPWLVTSLLTQEAFEAYGTGDLVIPYRRVVGPGESGSGLLGPDGSFAVHSTGRRLSHRERSESEAEGDLDREVGADLLLTEEMDALPGAYWIVHSLHGTRAPAPVQEIDPAIASGEWD